MDCHSLAGAKAPRHGARAPALAKRYPAEAARVHLRLKSHCTFVCSSCLSLKVRLL